ncbi:MAG: DUF6502 family protein [Alcanivorax sediminis]|uniref:Uncharacterized protein n=1 Tax=Alcanivorax sediminis TaxID=2663008 RepID=A0A6N7LZI6_9GAMM|nr:DUF6502 family protein [Alcanivorax sediminis]MQX54584.1 hypothetical protein [Alcanivorax sediminis]
MSDASTKTGFHKAVRKLMRPLVRMAIKRGVSVNDFYLWLKAIYVEEAESFTIEGKKQSTSRIALLTGLDRKETARLRKLNQDMDALLQLQTKRTNRAVRAINAWQKEALYSDGQGHPQALPLYGEGASFESLVQQYCGDVSVVTVLGELEQSGAIEVHDDDSVTLKDTSYIPHEDNEELLFLMGQAAHDLLNTSAYNIEQQGQTSRLQLSVAYNRVNPEVIAKLKVLIEADSLELLQKLDRWLDREIDHQGDARPEQYRAGVGIYYFEEPMDSGSEQ